MPRQDGRGDLDLRPMKMTPGFLRHPRGSVLIEVGHTRVLCAASVEDKVPPFMAGKGEGWITSEYAMLPAATSTRSAREIQRGRPSGRTMEIQRLIGRALRTVVHRRALGERTVWIDCDVLQADGGTRTASITGGFVALALALHSLHQERVCRGPLLSHMLAAVSVGLVEGRALLDMDYKEDSAAEVDMNVARLSDGRYVELQGTAESAPFSRARLDELLAVADHGIELLQVQQREVLGPALEAVLGPR